MAHIFPPVKIVYGVCEPKPIFGAPEGRQRLRLRNNNWAKLFVKTPTAIRCFVLEDCGDRWFCNPRLEQGKNMRFIPVASTPESSLTPV
jgi:hypothetical protein